MAWIKWIIMFIMLMLFTVSQGVEVESICPVFVDKEAVTIECRINSSEIVTPRCFDNPTTVSYFFTTPLGSTSNTLCNADFPNTTCDISKSGCGCTSKSGFMFIYNYTFIANESLHGNVSFKCSVNCVIPSPPLTENQSSCAFITFVPPPPTPPVTPCKNCSCTDNCPPSAKCPDWCIAVSVCVSVGGVGLITITVIIIKKKKEKLPGCSCIVESSEGGCNGTKSAVEDTEEMKDKTKHHGTENRPMPAHGGSNRTEESVHDTKEMEDKTKHHGTENRPKNAQGGSNRIEESVQDTNEMQDKTKHLGTENSPEREKRRKKKKKKKTFQEVDGESVSRENKSTVNDHKAAQNDNSVSVNENSPITYNGELRSLPMPKIPHLTSVERNSTIFQSETPRKLPPLQPKQ